MGTPKVSIHYINQDAERVCTSYWGSHMEKQGLFFLWWNDGEGRLLVPRKYEHTVDEMLTGRKVIIICGNRLFVTDKNAVEILFDDGTDAPFYVEVNSRQCSQLLPDNENGITFPFGIWTRAGQVAKFTGCYKYAAKFVRKSK